MRLEKAHENKQLYKQVIRNTRGSVCSVAKRMALQDVETEKTVGFTRRNESECIEEACKQKCCTRTGMISHTLSADKRALYN